MNRHNRSTQSNTRHCDLGAAPAFSDNAAAGMATDGAYLYALSEISRTDNGDLIATVDSRPGHNDTYSFIKYALSLWQCDSYNLK